MRALGLSVTVERELESVIAIKQFVERGRLYTILPRDEIGQEIAAGSLAVIPTRPALQRTLSLAWTKERTFDGPLRALHAIMRQETAQLIATGAWGTSFLQAPRVPSPRESVSGGLCP